MLYSDKVMDHFEHPRNVGEIENADGVGQVGNPKCGDIMKMYLKIDGDIITDVKFNTFGCGSQRRGGRGAGRAARLQDALLRAGGGGHQGGPGRLLPEKGGAGARGPQAALRL